MSAKWIPDVKKLALATVAGGFGMWILAGLWHSLIAVSFYTRETEATHEGTGIILVAYLVLGVLMAYLYSLAYKGGRPPNWLETTTVFLLRSHR